MALQIVTRNSRETKKLAGVLTKEISTGRWITGRRAAILVLSGDLGSGKTTFIQGFAKGLGVKEKVLSPTFVILKKFKIQNSKFKNFYHLDCYRIENPKEILDLGFKEIINEPENIVLIEWGEKIKKILPKSAVWLEFEWLGKNKRRIALINSKFKIQKSKL